MWSILAENNQGPKDPRRTFDLLPNCVQECRERTCSAGSHQEEPLPWQRSWGRKPDKTQGMIRLQGEPLKFSEHPPPKPESACRTTLCFSSTLLTLTGDLSPHQLFLGKVNLELLDNKSPGHNRVFQSKPLWWLFSLPAWLLQLCMWLFTVSQPGEAQEA